jgi:hypothetical protein
VVLFYCFWQFVRKLVFVGTVMATNSPKLQIGANITCSAISLMFVLNYRPFAKQIYIYTKAVNELTLISLYTCLILLSGSNYEIMQDIYSTETAYALN